MSSFSTQTLLFIGAGATAKLAMPPTNDQADILYKLCDCELTVESIPAECFEDCRKDVYTLLKLLEYEEDSLQNFTDEQTRLFSEAFPDASSEEQKNRVIQLRRTFDWPALKCVGQVVKRNTDFRSGNYLQEVFDLIDVLLREHRGMSVCPKAGNSLFLSPARLQGARELLIYLINTMFACAWLKLQSGSGKKTASDVLAPYRGFCDSLAKLMQEEAWEKRSLPLNSRKFYQFSYSILTTNFEPIFLWMLFQAHKRANRNLNVRLGAPGKKLQLMLDFPNTLGMRSLADEGASKLPDDEIWYPMTSAVAQRINDEKHLSDRVVRIGKYYFVHGSSNFRHCPKCGRLTLSLGDSWDENSKTLFTPGVIKAFSWDACPRTANEKEAHRRGEYDAMECSFCGQMTYAQDNFMHMQTHFKGRSPSFIKEITDEALASLPSVQHVVMLGYSFPTDDAIWTSDFKAMLECDGSRRKVYCSVICGYDGSDDWKYGDDLQRHLELYGEGKDADKYGVGSIRNAISIFGRAQVRAYTGGIPQVFHGGDLDSVREILYPHRAPWNHLFADTGETH